MICDVIIIGGGPAGATAGIYAARQKLYTLLITKDFGGQLVRKAGMIENYPGFEEIPGADLVKKFENHFRKYIQLSRMHQAGHVDIEIDQIVKVEKENGNFAVITKSQNKYEAKTVIVATGADPRPLEVEGEKEFIGKGVSYCTVCDGALFPNKIVAIAGGGNSGFEAALFMAKIAKKIYILEAGSEIRADKENQDAVERTGKAEILTQVLLKKIQGEKFVKSLLYEDKKTGKEITLPVEGVFVEIGYQPATSFVKGLVEFTERDEIKVDFETFQTKTPGLFAAGDCNAGKYKQIITAAGEGAKAALAAFDYIGKLKK